MGRRRYEGVCVLMPRYECVLGVTAESEEQATEIMQALIPPDTTGGPRHTLVVEHFVTASDWEEVTDDVREATDT